MATQSATMFDPIKAGDLHLANRFVMAPLTRNRATHAVPTALMAEYYAQRASAGLLITETTVICQQGRDARMCRLFMLQNSLLVGSR